MEENVDLQAMDEELREDEITEEKLINEEYKTWKKNAPFLYDYMLSTALEWPTLTTQWLPDKRDVPGKDYSTHRLLLGTHTANDAPNYLELADVQIPNPVSPDAADYDEEREEIGGYGGGASKKNAGLEVKFHIVQKIHHPGEVNKARYQWQNPNIIATMCTDGRVMVWDRTKLSSVPDISRFEPQMELTGHTSEGWGLSWSHHQQGLLATGTNDKTVKLWDTRGGYSRGTKEVKATRTFTHHKASVNDVEFHPKLPGLIASASDDITAQIVDTREAGAAALSTPENGHADAVNTVAWNPATEYLLATGSADKTIGLWDLRNLKVKLHALQAHQDAVSSIEWHPHEEAVLGSASYDRRVIFWDLSKVGDEQTPEDAEDGPPEILFMHGGHTNRVSDFSWNRNDPWVLCSAAEDNLMQVWKVANAIVGKEPEDIPMAELEN